jgi:hypothetical protein
MASMDFYSYRKYVPWNDSVELYAKQWLGYSQLESSEVTVTPKGGYLDIIEDAWISSDLTQLHLDGVTNDYFFQGSLPIPAKAAVTGVQTWKGDTLFRAHLKPASYLSDNRYPDSASVHQALDSRVILFQQNTSSGYELTLSRLSLGERKHVRIRYMLPNTGGGSASYSIPILFNTPNGARPRFVTITVRADSGDLSYNLVTGQGEIQLRDSSSHIVPYQSSFNLLYAPRVSSTMHLTSFNQGAWAGTYLMLNTALTDTIIARLSKPIQTVFVWRWNSENGIVEYDQYMQLKGLSAYGYQLVGQARAIRDAAATLARSGNRCALIHSVTGRSDYTYTSPELDDSSQARLDAYLAQFDEQTLYQRYNKTGTPQPTWVPQKAPGVTEIERGRTEFVSALSRAADLLVDTSTSFRHTVVVSAGGVYTSRPKNMRSTVDSIFAGLTVYSDNAQWLGVDVGASVPSMYEQGLQTWAGYYFPSFSPVTVQLKINNQAQPYSFPMSGRSLGTLAVALRTALDWDTTLQWIGFDQNGVVTSSTTESPQVFRTPMDSGLAKVWARDESHVAEKEEVYPGGTFGIVTKATYLQATMADMYFDYTETVPFLADEEIQAPRSPVKRPVSAACRQTVSVKISGAMLCLESSHTLRALRVFDIHGRLVRTIDLRKYGAGSGSFRVPLSAIRPTGASSIFVVTIEGEGIHQSLKLTAGGIQW